MSAHDNHAHGAGGESHGSVKSYLIGFVLAAILTIIPFWVVMSGGMSSFATGAVIVVAGILQLLVHLVFFLHLDAKAEGGWNMLALIFPLVLVVIMLAGSLWVMHHLDTNMMPMSPHEVRGLP